MPARPISSAPSNAASNCRPVTVAPDGAGLYRALLMRLPYRVRESLDHEQREALRVAAEELHWGSHPVDIRVSLPLPGLPMYLAIFAGYERRGGWKSSLTQALSFNNRAGLLVAGTLIFSSLLAVWWWLGGPAH